MQAYQLKIEMAELPTVWRRVIVVFTLLEQIAATKNIGVIRFLERWKETEVKRVQARINWAISEMRNIK